MVYLNFFNKGNLGDDLFVRIVCKEFREFKFVTVGNPKYKHLFSNIKNLNYIAIPHTGFIFKKQSRTILFPIGSGFMEPSPAKKTREKERHDSFFIEKTIILSSNFGPYKSKEFLSYYKQLFNKALFVSFREKNSFDLFSKLPNKNIYLFPDLAFLAPSLNETFSCKNKTRDLVIIPTNIYKDMDCDSIQKSNAYIVSIRRFLQKYSDKYDKITFINFCNEQGDGDITNKILSPFNQIKDKVEIIDYDSSAKLLEILNTIKSASLVVSSRYHGVILGLAYHVKTISVSYSDKTKNVLSDLNLSDINVDAFDLSPDSLINATEMIYRSTDYQLSKTVYNSVCLKLKDEIGCIRKLLD